MSELLEIEITHTNLLTTIKKTVNKFVLYRGTVHAERSLRWAKKRTHKVVSS